MYIASLLSVLAWIGIPFYILGLGMQVTHMTTLLLILVFVFGKIITKDYEILSISNYVDKSFLWILISIFIILAVGLTSSLCAANLVETMKFEVGYIQGLMVILIFVSVLKSNNNVNFVLNALILGGVITSVVVFAGSFSPFIAAITKNEFGRAEGFLLHPNQLGIFIAAVIPISVARLVTEYHGLKHWLVLVLLIGCLVLSGSKTNIFVAGMLGLTVLLLVSLLKKDFFRKFISLLGAMFVTIVTVLLAITLMQELIPRVVVDLQNFMANPESYRSIVSRHEIWSKAILLAQQNPFFGVGAGNSVVYLQANHAHNVFIEFYLTMGVFGVLALINFLASLFYLCWLSIKISKLMNVKDKAIVIGLCMGIFSYVLSNQLSDSFGGTTLPMLWILTGLLIALVNNHLKRLNFL